MPRHLRHVRHVHSGWPAPYAGMIAAVLFGVVVVGFLTMIVLIMR